MIDHPPRVFISYAQESESHSAWVLALAQRLRDDGVDALVDRYFPWVERGWRAWMSEQIEQADWVLVVCTAEYRKRFDGNAPGGSGRGVRWESQHITQALYDDRFTNKRFVPVLEPAGADDSIPLALKDYCKFRLDDDYEALYRLLTEQPATPAPALGQLRQLSPLPQPAKPIEPSPLGMAPPPAIANPYPGLSAFQPADSRVFFGRDKDTQAVVEHLQETRLVSVVGGSGTGKSSLVAAGVEPALRQLHARLTYLRFKPQADPFEQLAQTLDRELPEERLVRGDARVTRIQRALEGDAERAVANLAEKLPAPILLFADQFEELFTQTPPATAQRFRTLFAALRERPGVFLVLTLRSEFMHRLMDWLGGEVFASSLVPLGPITDEDRLREIITRPAEASGVAVDPDLVRDLQQAARDLAGALPLLALALKQLFAQRDPARGLTPEGYQDMGGLRKVVETAAADIDQAIDDDPALAAACERLFGELATVIDDLPTRRTAEVGRWREDSKLSSLVDDLRTQGLLADPDDRHVELAHETLLVHWPRLHVWCGQYSDKLVLRRQAEQAAGEWQKARARETASGEPSTARRSDHLRWPWERQKPALEALLALNPHLAAPPDADFADTGIAAWRSLTGRKLKLLKRFLAPEPWRLLHELRRDETPHHRREEIGLRLNQMGDPRRGVGLDADGLPEIVWVDIPRGEVKAVLEIALLDTFDTDAFDTDEFDTDPLETAPPETVALHAFRIAKYPITWRQYRAFIKAADGYHDARWWDGIRRPDQPGNDRWGFANHPAINVSWYDAVAFCRWLSHRLRLAEHEAVRLPTEWEWQWVAQAGVKTREYPWSDEWNTMRANSGESGIGRTTAVGMYPLGAPAGWPILDLAGNVWEWCLNADEPSATTSYGQSVSGVLRGGAWRFSPWGCRAKYRLVNAASYRYGSFGFRVCRASVLEPASGAPLNTVRLKR